MYWGSHSGRTFDILIDVNIIATQTLTGKDPGKYFSESYPIPPALICGRTSATITFRDKPGSNAGGVFDVRIVANR